MALSTSRFSTIRMVSREREFEPEIESQKVSEVKVTPTTTGRTGYIFGVSGENRATGMALDASTAARASATGTAVTTRTR